MPFESQAQSRYIHRKANLGEAWAKRFVRDAQHGKGALQGLPMHTKRKSLTHMMKRKG